MKVVIFLGPSLPLEEARQILDAVYLPPAQQADIVSVVGMHRPDVIGLVDGEFGQSLSVWHKEILYALDRGIHVFGASSMGALRAAETDMFGMIGVGEVYRQFASGELTGDDEVALAHGRDEAGYRALSEPMVNLRANFRGARDAGVIDDVLCARLTAIAKAMYFPQRSFVSVFRAAMAEGVPAETVTAARAWITDHYRDIKREDARTLLRTIRDLPQSLTRAVPAFHFERTGTFETMYQRDRKVRVDDVDLRLAAIANYAALHLLDYASVRAQALNRVLTAAFADYLGIEIPDEAVDEEAKRFRLRRQLTDSADFDAWRSRNHLEVEEFRALMRGLAETRAIQQWLMIRKGAQGITREVLDELRLRGGYESIAGRAALQESIVGALAPGVGGADEEPDTLRLVVDHLRATSCRMDASYADWSLEAGFLTVDDLRLELLRARATREYLARAAAVVAPARDVNESAVVDA